MREGGCYWVKFEWSEVFMIAEYFFDNKHPFWSVLGLDGIYNDSDFEQIDERRIERED